MRLSHTSLSSSLRTAIALALLAVLTIVASAPAAERSITIRGKHRAGVVVFKAPKLKGKKIRVLKLRIAGRTRTLSAGHRRTLSRRGVVRIRVRTMELRALRARKRRKPAPAPTTPPPVTSPDGSAAPLPPSTSTPTSPVLVVVVDAPEPAPAPAPRPGTPNCPGEPVWGGGVVPSACWRPYADTSPFNRRIPANPPVLSRSDEYVRKLNMYGGPQALPTGDSGTTGDYSHPTYYSRPSDPEFTIHCVEAWGRCPIEGMRIRIPDRAQAAGGSDGHMTVVDPATGWEYDFWQVRNKPQGGGTISISWGGRTRIDGDGLGSHGTAAGFAGMAGIIRAPELAAGRIEHALFMIYRCDSEEWAYPAAKGGSHCSDAGLPTAGAFPMGTRFQLDMSTAEIEALRVPRWKKTILHAMAEYGMYFGDTGGRSWAVQLESGSTYTSFGIEDPVTVLARDAGVPEYDGVRWMNMADGVDWSRLRAVDPCTARGTC